MFRRADNTLTYFAVLLNMLESNRCVCITTGMAPWYLQRHVDPRKWGRYGWAFLKGTAWIVDHAAERDRVRLFQVWQLMVHLQPALLLCHPCSQHFFRFLASTAPGRWSSHLEWMHAAS